MAQWAELLFYATVAIGVISVAIAAIGVYIVRRTLDLQRVATEASTEATRAAIRSADAASHSIEQTRAHFVTSERAWLSVDFQIASGLTWVLPDIGRIEIQYSIHNWGKTPAQYAYVYRIICGTANTRDEIDRMNANVRNHPFRTSGVTIFPGSNLRITQSVDFARPVNELLCTVRLVGTIVYELVFSNERRQTQFCVSIGHISALAINHSDRINICNVRHDVPQDQLRFFTAMYHPRVMAD